METQTWHDISVEWRTPTPADVTLSGAVWYLLHVSPQVPEAIAAVAALVMLRCIRRRRTSEIRR
ncbi:hypothetical protein [Streptomyces dubilierae]|uniref:Uncharacterized protein n=1 Tax=Streptomyces dubilierae TaxID=3075533 RepID=A0ABU2PAH8_9ACTN|nr:hypothetical protein [Streptomyces sp. DSM 41921]MDT0388280.1 hypothetical protein [Streptomyces sp. DSM 41921]